MDGHVSWMHHNRVFYDMCHGSRFTHIGSMIYGMFHGHLDEISGPQIQHIWAIFYGTFLGHLNVLQWRACFHGCVIIGYFMTYDMTHRRTYLSMIYSMFLGVPVARYQDLK